MFLVPFERVKVDNLEVHTNGSGEVFVTNTRSGVTIRIGDDGRNIRVTAAGCHMTPWAVNGLPAFEIWNHE